MLRSTLISIFIISSLIACKKPASKPDEAASGSASQTAKAANSQALQLHAEDIYTVNVSAMATGPVVTGVINPARRADLRAEVASIVTQVLKENGDSVKRDEILLRLDDTSIRDNLRSAEEAVRAANQSLSQAERQLERQKTLRASGMTSTQTLEDAQLRRNNAQNELLATKARAAQAQQQLTRTVIRAPFDGVVSERKASVGDTAQIGKELLKVIDPNSMRFDGLVTSESIGSLQLGQTVHFKINGYKEEEFVGSVKRIDPSANNATRQIAVQIDFSGQNRPKVAGLYAEGRIETTSTSKLSLPENVLQMAGDKAYVWRTDGKTLSKVAVLLGARDTRTGAYAVAQGVKLGERLIRNPTINLRDGQAVQIAMLTVPAAKSSSKPAAESSAPAAASSAGK